jgi:ribosomal protein L7Ae-like RNA K-turn-binding protein
MDRKIASFISISMRAGKLTTGEAGCESALRGGEAKLILIAEDASDNTKKKRVHKSFYYKSPAYIYGLKDDLSHMCGTKNRAVFAVTDGGLAAGIEKQLKQSNVTEVDSWQK